MNAEQIFRALGLIDPELVADAVPGPAIQRRHPPGRSLLAAAACLTVLCVAGGWLITGGFQGFGSGGSGNAPGEASGGSSGEISSGEGNENDRMTFMQYSGPVFPLATVEDPAGLTAERTLTWDFSPGAYPDGEPRQWGANVMDAYALTNSTDEAITATVLYPFSGNFRELYQQLPSVTRNGVETETTLYAGTYSGGFQSTFGSDIPDTLNLDTLSSWEEYKTLLDSGEYLAQALGEAPVLDVPVTVYDFTDFAAPHQTYQAATQAIAFTIEENTTQIFTYGFNGLDSDENGFRRYSYFVPDGRRAESNVKLLIVLGEDIQDYTLQGYQDGGCNSGEEIDGVSCTVTRTETTLDMVLDRLCQAYMEEYIKYQASDQNNAFDTVPFPMYRRAVAELLTQYGPLGENAMDRYLDGRLDDILSETLSQDRVFYLSFPVTIPAGDHAELAFQFWKSPSHNFFCDSDGDDLQGYDLVTQLGSALTFSRQTVLLENTETITIARQNLGFDLEKGITSVTLDLSEEHYYLEIQEKGN